MTFLKTIGFKTASLTGLLGIVFFVFSISAYAWGPERDTFTIEEPPDYITFNSFTNNPNHGDERNFVSAKEINEGSDAWRDVIDVTIGDTYSVNIYVHNNAAGNMNLVAENTRIHVVVPSWSGTEIQIDGTISSNNASPQKVWDQIVFRSPNQPFRLEFVPGSARYYNNESPSNHFTLPDEIVQQNGALIGYKAMDGKVPGCFQYTGIANFSVIAVGGESDSIVETDIQSDSNFLDDLASIATIVGAIVAIISMIVAILAFLLALALGWRKVTRLVRSHTMASKKGSPTIFRETGGTEESEYPSNIGGEKPEDSDEEGFNKSAES